MPDSSRSTRRTKRRSTRGGTPIGQLLLKNGSITEEQLNQALQTQQQEGGLLGQILTRMGGCGQVEMVKALGKQFRVTSVDLSDMQLPPEIVGRVRRGQCESDRLIPFELLGNLLCVAMANVLQRKAVQIIQEDTGLKVKAFSCLWPEIKQAIEKWHTPGAEDAARAAIENPMNVSISNQEEAAVLPTAPPTAEAPPPEPEVAPAAAPTPAQPQPQPVDQPKGFDPDDPFAGDLSQLRRKKRDRTSDLKRQLMAGGGPPSTTPPAEPAATVAPSEDMANEPPPIPSGESYEAPLYVSMKSMDVAEIEALPMFSYADVADFVQGGNVSQSDVQRIQAGDIPPDMSIAAELSNLFGLLPNASVVARSRDELRKMAEAEAQISAAFGDESAVEEVAAVADAVTDAPLAAPAEEPLAAVGVGIGIEEDEEAVEEIGVLEPLAAAVAAPDDGAPFADGLPPLPALEPAVAISDAEFENLVGPNAEIDPAQEWETLVAYAGPIAATPQKS